MWAAAQDDFFVAETAATFPFLNPPIDMSDTTIELSGENIDLHKGLDPEQVRRFSEKFGSNTLTPPERDPWWTQLLEKFNDPTIKILLVAAVISLLMTCLEKFVLGHPEASFIDSTGIFLAVLLATLCGFFSELKSAREFELLNKVKDDIKIKVLRAGQMTEVSINDIVVGDLVHLDLGDKIPADGVVLESMGLCVDQSVMTGESIPVEKTVFQRAGNDVLVSNDQLDDASQVYRGTMVADGHGAFLVTQVGDKTKLGQIAANLGKDNETENETPLTRKLTVLANQISVVGMTGAAFIFAVMAFFAFQGWTPDWTNGTFAGMLPLLKGLLTAFVVAVTIIVVAVPEGLPMMVTVSLAMNMMKMARENVLVRKLVASETIGSATVICTDKTGTLTQNKMRSVWLLLGLEEISLHAPGTAAPNSLTSNPLFPLLVDSIAINSEAALHLDGNEIGVIGNPTEGALLVFLHENGENYLEHREKFVRLKELSHNSERKMSAVLVDRGVDKLCYGKGAPDKLLERCTRVYVGDKIESVENYRAQINEALRRASEQALRVIAFTVKENDDDLECGGQTLLALIGIADPIRPEVRASVETCFTAGVAVKMITGDAEPTAIAIAKQAGILSEDYCNDDDDATQIRKGELALTTTGLAEMDDEQLLQAIPSLKVLARSTPMDKLRLVKAMHRSGEVVAMTGDGTNDAPALKFADVGVSMGKTGTEVAKEASDVVLIDDNFKSIVTGIWWGRTLYQNIQRFLQFQLSVNVVAMSCALIGPLVGIPLPLTVPQLLWINIIMDTFAAIALSCDPPRRKSMERKPISRDASIITPSMGLSILMNSLYQVVILLAALYCGWFLTDEAKFDFAVDPLGKKENLEALTVFFTIFVMFQFWHKFNCRSLRYDESPFELLHKNKLFLVIVGTITATQVVMVQASAYLGIGEIFRTVALDLTQWMEIALLTATIIPVAWAVRLMIHRLGWESWDTEGAAPA